MPGDVLLPGIFHITLFMLMLSYILTKLFRGQRCVLQWVMDMLVYSIQGATF